MKTAFDYFAFSYLLVLPMFLGSLNFIYSIKMADKASKIQQFIEVTAVPEKQAKEILEQYDWNCEDAVQAFLAGAYNEDDEMETGIPPEPTQGPKPAAAESSSGKGKASMLDVWDDEKKEKKGKDGQYFYVGGEHSGEVVIGPDRKNNSEMVKRLFDAAKEHGAEPVSPEEDRHEHRQRSTPFGGAGFRLGSTGETSAAPTSRMDDEKETRPEQNYRLRMWENGFSIDDGDLRPYDNPENQRFLQAITQGRIPDELLRQARGAEVHVDLEDRRTEQHTEQHTARPKVVAFSGEGHRLGSVVPPMTTDAPAASSRSAATSKKPEETKMEIDEAQPTTTVQIRLADGSRLVTKANHTHTISQLRDFICRARPNLAHSPFVLMTMFPNKELSDESLTLSAAGLLNAAIIQRAGKVA